MTLKTHASTAVKMHTRKVNARHEYKGIYQIKRSGDNKTVGGTGVTGTAAKGQGIKTQPPFHNYDKYNNNKNQAKNITGVADDDEEAPIVQC